MRSKDIHQNTTASIVAAIEAGAGDYQMPWNPRLCGSSPLSIPHNPVGGYSYRGINILTLWGCQEQGQFPTPVWASYQQWQSMGAQVRKGEKAAQTVFFKPLDADHQTRDEVEDGDGQSGRQGRGFIARAANVFNAAQVDGYNPEVTELLEPIKRHSQSEALITSSGAHIVSGGPRACYIPSRDQIHLPPAEAFVDPEAYYGVAFHELTHWTGHENRCNRNLAGRFGTEAYAMEELVAELGAAFLSAELGVTPEPRIDHARYISSWLRVLRQDKRAIFLAATKAGQAADFLRTLAQNSSTSHPDEQRLGTHRA